MHVAKKMPIVAPSLTYATTIEYTAYMERLNTFANRVHIDLTDGDLAPSRLIELAQVWWPERMIADVHLMYRRPLDYTEQLIYMRPSLVIVHLDALGDIASFGRELQKFDIRFGIALTSSNQIKEVEPLLKMADHALIFSGKLGFYGGKLDPKRLSDVSLIRSINPVIEIGWDGGVNAETAGAISKAGIDVLNVGSGIAASSDPAKSYATINEVINNSMLENGGQI